MKGNTAIVNFESGCVAVAGAGFCDSVSQKMEQIARTAANTNAAANKPRQAKQASARLRRLARRRGIRQWCLV